MSAVALGECPAYNAYNFPNLNRKDRGPDQDYGDKYPTTGVLGYIPQVEHTYGYVDASYGVQNEHGLSMGECTNGVLQNRWPWDGDNERGPVKRLFYSSELSRVAMERCKLAKDAVRVMGNLIDRYGYWGTGECLPIWDEKEAWVFEMAPSNNGEGGYWWAKKVPDDGYFVAGNQFRIRSLNTKNVHACGTQWIVGEEAFSARLAFDFFGGSVPEDTEFDPIPFFSVNEYSHPMYSFRREWYAMTQVNKGLDLSPVVTDSLAKYPEFVVPDRKLTKEDLFKLHSSHYEGTKYDIAQKTKLTAGPWGNPHRANTEGYDLGGDCGTGKVLEGAWERPICHYYIGQVWVCEPGALKFADGNVANLVWSCAGTPCTGIFIPISPNVGVPHMLIRATSTVYDWSKFWWVANEIQTLADSRYAFNLEDHTGGMREDIENRREEIYDSINSMFSEIVGGTLRDSWSEWSSMYDKIMDAWRELYKDLRVKWNQYFKNTNEEWAEQIGYPPEWIDGIVEEWRDGPKTYDFESNLDLGYGNCFNAELKAISQGRPLRQSDKGQGTMSLHEMKRRATWEDMQRPEIRKEMHKVIDNVIGKDGEKLVSKDKVKQVKIATPVKIAVADKPKRSHHKKK
jgi:dipeptidase